MERFALGGLPIYHAMQTRSVSPENPAGEKGGGAKAVPLKDNLEVPLHHTTDHLGRGWKNRPFIRVKAGETAELMNVDGPGEIRHMWLLAWGMPGSDAVPHTGILRFYWDGEEEPSAEVPAADFFAVGERFRPVDSLMVNVSEKNALSCWWPMPFRKHARITFTNSGTETVGVMTWQITYEKMEIGGDVMYFHAAYRRAYTGDENPYTLLDVRGRGKYVGSVLSVHSLDDGWFGEGEFKLYIDGDGEFPTICGTGTEDYFLCSYGLNQHCSLFSGVPLLEQYQPGESRAGDMATMYRWHIMDPICFEKELRVNVQALGPVGDISDSGIYSKRRDIYSSVAYWYQQH